MKKAKLSFDKACHVHKEQTVELQKLLDGTLGRRETGAKAVLVGGTSGTGKTHMVETCIRNAIEKHGSQLPEQEKVCWFASAKFDQKGGAAPFGEALNIAYEITQQILACKGVGNDSEGNKSDTEEPSPANDLFDACCAALHSEFSSCPPRYQELLLEKVPAALPLFDKQAGPMDEESERSAKSTDFNADHISSTRLAFRSFLKAVSTVSPIVLSIDDIMWGDADTLEVFKLLLSSSNDADHSLNVLFCATYRTDAQESSEEEKNTIKSTFSTWQKELQETLQDKLKMLSVQNLAITDIKGFLEDTLPGLDHSNLAALLHERTDGNIFYVIQTLENLRDLDLLKYQCITGYAWTYSLEEIRTSTSICDNVGQLVCSRIEHLDPPIQEILKLSSCFGAVVEVKALEVVQQALRQEDGAATAHSNNVTALLERACQEMMLIRVSESTFKFSHDQIQAAAYGMISSNSNDDSKDTVKQLHWRIGQSLLHSKIIKGNQSLVFACAEQLKRAGLDNFIESKSEDRRAIAHLSLTAGKIAAGMSAFLMASGFFQLGIDALGGSTGFDQDYDLTMKLFSMYARTEQCGGSIARSKEAAETILLHAKNQDDRVAAYRVLLSCFLAANQIDELIDFGLSLCEKLGEKISKNPKPRQVQREVEKTRKKLLKTSNAQILSMQPIHDNNKELCMNVLFELAMPAYYVGNHTLHYAIVNKMNQITLSHGLSKWSPKSFALSGQHFTANYNDFKEGYRYAQLALILLGDYKEKKSGGSVVFHVAIIRACIEPATSSLDLLLSGYKSSMEVGNINFAFTNIFNYFWTYFYSGLPFQPLLDDIDKFSKQMLDYNRHYMFLMALPVWQCLLNLSGRAKDRGIMDGGEALEKESLVGGNPKGAGRQTMMSYWMQLSFYLGNMEKANELYDQVKGFDMGAFKATMFFNARIFFFALIETHNYRKTGKNKYRKTAKQYRDMLRKHVAGGAINLVHKVQLLEVEIKKRTAKNTDEVLRGYQAAIVSATRSGFLQDAALSNHLCAQYCRSKPELLHMQNMYLVAAHEKYTAWGATAVAESLAERYPAVFDPNLKPIGDDQPKFEGHRSSSRFSDLTQGLEDRDEQSSCSGMSSSFGFGMLDSDSDMDPAT